MKFKVEAIEPGRPGNWSLLRSHQLARLVSSLARPLSSAPPSVPAPDFPARFSPDECASALEPPSYEHHVLALRGQDPTHAVLRVRLHERLAFDDRTALPLLLCRRRYRRRRFPDLCQPAGAAEDPPYVPPTRVTSSASSPPTRCCCSLTVAIRSFSASARRQIDSLQRRGLGFSQSDVAGGGDARDAQRKRDQLSSYRPPLGCSGDFICRLWVQI